MNRINSVFKVGILRDSVYFKIFFLLWALVHNFTVGQRYTGYLSPIVLLWGMLLLIRNLFIERAKVPKGLMYLIYAFLASYVVTIIINAKLNLIGNTKTLIWAMLMTLVLFITEYSKDNQKVYRDVNIISKLLVIVLFIVSFISILMFCLDICFWIPKAGGKLVPQGYYAARLWGIFVDPNQGCAIATVALLLSLILLIQRKTLNKIFLIISIFVQYIFIILTGSRGGEIALIFVLIGLGYLLFDYILRNNIKGNLIRGCISVLVGIIISVLVIISFDDTRKILSYVPKATVTTQQYISSTTGIESGEHNGNVTVVRPDAKTSNGRIRLWTDGFRLTKFAPVFGFGDRNIAIKAAELTPGSSLETQVVHNGFIHMLLSGGLVATIIMLIFIGIIAVKALKIFFGAKNRNKDYYIYSILCLIVLCLLITTVFLTELFYQNSFVATAFWIFIGHICVLNEGEIQ